MRWWLSPAGNPPGSEAGAKVGAFCRWLTWDSAVLAPRLKAVPARPSPGLRGLALHQFWDRLWCWAPFDCRSSAAVHLSVPRVEMWTRGIRWNKWKLLPLLEFIVKLQRMVSSSNNDEEMFGKGSICISVVYRTQSRTSQIPSTGRLIAMESFCNGICLGSADSRIFNLHTYLCCTVLLRLSRMQVLENFSNKTSDFYFCLASILI